MRPRATDFELFAIEETAADWFVRRRDGLPPEAEARYQAWVAADPRHAAAIFKLEATWDKVSFPFAIRRGQEAANVLDRWEARGRRRRGFFVTTGLATAAALVFAVLPSRPPPATAPRAVPMAVRPNIETLPDGSTVEFNAGAEITVEFTSDQRKVRLVTGEALFSVGKDAARPFVVWAGGVEVRAVGTAFVVRCETKEVGVLVTAGRVAVARMATGGPMESSGNMPLRAIEPIYLDAGRRVALATDRAGDVSPVIAHLSAEEIGAALAWRGRRVEFSRIPLADAAALFNRQNRVQLSLADAATGAMPISGVFWSDDPEAFVRLLESGLGVRSERSGDTIVLVNR